MPDFDPWVVFAYVITVAWVVYTGRGTWNTYRNLEDARVDRGNLLSTQPLVNGILLLEANGGVSDQRAILIQLAADFLTGVVSLAMLVLIPPNRAVPTAPLRLAASVFISILLTVGAVALVRMSEAKRVRHRAQLELLRRTIILPHGPT